MIDAFKGQAKQTACRKYPAAIWGVFWLLRRRLTRFAVSTVGSPLIEDKFVSQMGHFPEMGQLL